MSIKKAASSPARKSTPSANRKSSAGKSTANGQAATSAAKRAHAPSERPLTHLHIGDVAGEVWGLLAESDGQTLAAIKKSINAPADLVVAAVGWLAREDKLAFVASGRTVKLALKQ